MRSWTGDAVTAASTQMTSIWGVDGPDGSDAGSPRRCNAFPLRGFRGADNLWWIARADQSRCHRTRLRCYMGAEHVAKQMVVHPKS